MIRYAMMSLSAVKADVDRLQHDLDNVEGQLEELDNTTQETNKRIEKNTVDVETNRVNIEKTRVQTEENTVEIEKIKVAIKEKIGYLEQECSKKDDMIKKLKAQVAELEKEKRVASLGVAPLKDATNKKQGKEGCFLSLF